MVVADGVGMVKGFTWTIQPTTFTSDMFFISLGCCDLVLLGIEWLVALGDISWNFDKLAMAFQIGGKWHVLHCAMTNGIHKPQ